jgi:hypothetical protein
MKVWHQKILIVAILSYFPTMGLDYIYEVFIFLVILAILEKNIKE